MDSQKPRELGPLTSGQNEAPARGLPGLPRLATRVLGDIANPTSGIISEMLKQPGSFPILADAGIGYVFVNQEGRL
jgi:hypothetical protein